MIAISCSSARDDRGRAATRSAVASRARARGATGTPAYSPERPSSAECSVRVRRRDRPPYPWRARRRAHAPGDRSARRHRLDPDQRADLVARYRAGHAAVVAAVEGITDAELDARPEGEDEWTPREIVHHLADSEMTSAIRLRRLIAEEQPVIAGYDEAEWARRLHYDDRPIGPSLDALAAARATTADLLDRLTDAEWGRERVAHRERGLRRRALARDLRGPRPRPRRPDPARPRRGGGGGAG